MSLPPTLSPDSPIQDDQPGIAFRRRWWLIPVLLILIFALIWILNGNNPVAQGRFQSVEFLLAKLKDLESAKATHPLMVFVAAFLLYITVTGLSLPGATIMSLGYGWMFGFLPALVLVSFASTTGATIAFLISRYLLQESIQRRFGSKLEGFNTALKQEGAYYLFTLRLIPAVPFFIINVVMGLTPISVTTYWWVSQLGMLPGTAVYVYAGASLPGLDQLRDPTVSKILSPQLLLSLVLLGVFPLVVKWIARYRNNRLRVKK